MTTDQFLVNTYTAAIQSYSSVTALADGGFVITWSSDGQDGSDYGIYGQRYNADGSKQGNEFQVNTYTASTQFESSVTALADGGFVVTWTSNGQDGGVYGIYGQRYNADGSKQGNEFQVNTYTASTQYGSSVTALADEEGFDVGFVVTWWSDGQDGSSAGIYGQRYDAEGGKQGSEFQVNTYTASSQYDSSVTALADGGFVVTWSSVLQDGSGNGVYGQRYNAEGVKQGSEFQVNTYTASSQFDSSVTALADGGFVVTWTSDWTPDGIYGNDLGVYGQRYDAEGVKQGNEFQVNTYSSRQYSSSVTALADGGFIVTWQSDGQDGSYDGVYGQQFDADGEKVGAEILINQYTDGSQYQPEVCTLSDGRIVVIWNGTGTGDASGVYARILTPIPTNADPVLDPSNPLDDQIVSVDELFSINLIDGNFTDVDQGDILSYSAAGLPAGVTLDPTSGILSGTATSAGVFTVTVTATDDYGGTANDDFDLIVANNSATASADVIYMDQLSGKNTDKVNAKAGNDRVYGTAYDDFIGGAEGDDYLRGEGGDDKLIGGDDNDILLGGTGNDDLQGGDGNDTLKGWGGSLSEIDVLNGGDGADTYVLGNATAIFYTSDSELGYASIKAFEADDVIQLRGVPEQYSLGAAPPNTGPGNAVGLFTSDGHDLIAVITGGIRPETMDDSRFSFVVA